MVVALSLALVASIVVNIVLAIKINKILDRSNTSLPLSAERQQELFSQQYSQHLIQEYQTLNSKLLQEHQALLDQLASQQTDVAARKQELLNVAASIEESFQAWKLKRGDEVQELTVTLQSLRSTADAANQVLLEHDKMLGNVIVVDRASQYEIAELNDVSWKLRNPVPLFKAIWECYYRDAVKEMITRVVGDTKVTGIYRITSVSSGKSYVGKSTDIAARWITHAKRGVGVDGMTAAGTKLYTALREEGLWNFTWEIVEVVDPDCLAEREKYWIQFLHTNESGWNERVG